MVKLLQVTQGRYGPVCGFLKRGKPKLAALRQALKEGEGSSRVDYSLKGLLDELDGDTP